MPLRPAAGVPARAKVLLHLHEHRHGVHNLWPHAKLGRQREAQRVKVGAALVRAAVGGPQRAPHRPPQRLEACARGLRALAPLRVNAARQRAMVGGRLRLRLRRQLRARRAAALRRARLEGGVRRVVRKAAPAQRPKVALVAARRPQPPPLPPPPPPPPRRRRRTRKRPRRGRRGGTPRCPRRGSPTASRAPRRAAARRARAPAPPPWKWRRAARSSAPRSG